MVFPQNSINGRTCHSEPQNEIPAYCAHFRIRRPDRGNRQLCSLEGGLRVEERGGVISLPAQAPPTAQHSAPSSLTAGRTYRSCISANIHLAGFAFLETASVPTLELSCTQLPQRKQGSIPAMHLAWEDALKASPPSPPPSSLLYFGVGMWCNK